MGKNLPPKVNLSAEAQKFLTTLKIHEDYIGYVTKCTDKPLSFDEWKIGYDLQKKLTALAKKYSIEVKS